MAVADEPGPASRLTPLSTGGQRRRQSEMSLASKGGKPRWNSMFAIVNPEHPPWSPTRRAPGVMGKALSTLFNRKGTGGGIGQGEGSHAKPKVKVQPWHPAGWKLHPARSEEARQRRAHAPVFAQITAELPNAEYGTGGRLVMLTGTHIHRHTHVESGITHTHKTTMRRMMPRSSVEIVFNQTVLYNGMEETLTLIDRTLEAIRDKTAVEMEHLEGEEDAIRASGTVTMRALRDAVLEHYGHEATAMYRVAAEHLRTDCDGCEAKACALAVTDAILAVAPSLAKDAQALAADIQSRQNHAAVLRTRSGSIPSFGPRAVGAVPYW